MMRPQESALFLLFALTLSSCGGNNSGSGGSTTTPPLSNPVPTVTTISPTAVDWYFNAPINDPGENLNSALEIVHNLPDRHGMQ